MVFFRQIRLVSANAVIFSTTAADDVIDAARVVVADDGHRGGPSDGSSPALRHRAHVTVDVSVQLQLVEQLAARLDGCVTYFTCCVETSIFLLFFFFFAFLMALKGS